MAKRASVSRTGTRGGPASEGHAATATATVASVTFDSLRAERTAADPKTQMSEEGKMKRTDRD